MTPDPCTLLYGVPAEAPDAGDPWNVAHWSHLAARAGLPVRPSPTGSGHGDPTWCGDVEIDGLVYRASPAALPVGPRLRFRLDLPPGQHAMLAAGLARVWSP